MSAVQAVIGSLAWLLAGPAAGSSGPGLLAMLGMAGVAVLLFAWMLGRLAGTLATEPAPAGRTYRDHVVFVRSRDPGTAGRPRPRAPSGSPALA
ncbi:DUF6412 domain-containing protein [Microbispora sp. NPDC049125]|uniref:DUF6412 domain-containing protein n=1 Tax=Microbispora sp. NPDC049125 TaxID=3154929 RepID=UPI003466DDAA